MMTPEPQFSSDDEAAQYWIGVLRAGSPPEQIEARDHLSLIFQRREMLSEAIELLESNGRMGARNQQLFLRLAHLYRQVGRDDDAEAAQYEAALLDAAQQTVVQQAWATPVSIPPVGNRDHRDDPLGFRPGAPRPWFLRMPGLILMSGLCFPPMAIALVWTRPWQKPVQIALTVPLGIWMLIYFTVAFGTGQPRPVATGVAKPTIQAAAPVAATNPEPTSRPLTATPAPPTATPIPPTPTLAPPTIIVVNAGQQGVMLRSAPSTGEQLKLLKDGDVLERVGDEEQLAAGKRWWKVRDPSDGTTGWVAAEFVAVAAAVPVPKPGSPSPEVQAYLDWLIPTMGILGQSSNALADQFRQIGQTPTLLLSDDWKLKTGIALGFMKNAGEELRSQERAVPPSAVSLDQDVRALGAEVVQMADEYAIALDRLDPQRLQRANERMQEATRKTNALTPKIQALRSH